MDYRYRRYYIVSLCERDYNENIRELKRAVPSLEIHKPYNHFVRSRKRKYEDVHDCRRLGGRYVHALLTCRKEDAKKLIDKINELKERYYGLHIYIKEYTQRVLGQ